RVFGKLFDAAQPIARFLVARANGNDGCKRLLPGLEELIFVLVQKAADVGLYTSPLIVPGGLAEVAHDVGIGLAFGVGVLVKVASQEILQIGVVFDIHGLL